jgi:hypothetical protein
MHKHFSAFELSPQLFISTKPLKKIVLPTVICYIISGSSFLSSDFIVFFQLSAHPRKLFSGPELKEGICSQKF